MEWQIELDPERDILRVVGAGDITAEALGALAGEVLRELARTGVSGVLVDHRRSRTVLSTLEIYQLPSQLTQMGLQKSVKVALVHSPDANEARDFQFYESACCLLGMTHLSFSDVDEALAWLLQESPAGAVAPEGDAPSNAGVEPGDR